MKPGDTILIHYKTFLKDGTLIDSSDSKNPFSFTLGSQEILPELEKMIKSMDVGETKIINLKPEEAFGSHKKDCVATIQKENLPKDIPLEKGSTLTLKSKNQDEAIYATITGIDGDQITIDANHPLSGKDIQFEVELIEVKQTQITKTSKPKGV